MNKLLCFEPMGVFKYFENICSVPHGSGNTDAIRDYLIGFAVEHGFKYYTDKANNVIIYKKATHGYKNSETVILQAHMDMVCQKTEDSPVDFEKDGLDLYVEDDFVKARGTTLGADNGIGVAMMLAILSDNSLEHPTLECVFTSDEEIGMLGALELDISVLKGKRMINLDGGGENSVLISCAGGADFKAVFECERKEAEGTALELSLSGLPGGHSGTQINKNYGNANALMIKILRNAYDKCSFEIIGINGGNKANVITPCCKAYVISDNPECAISVFNTIAQDTKKDIQAINPDMEFSVAVAERHNRRAIADTAELLEFAAQLPSGVIAMSKGMEDLVETSANFGIVSTEDSALAFTVSVRSCVQSELDSVLSKLNALCAKYGCTCSVSGIYPPWQLKKDTYLQKAYARCHDGKTDGPAVFRAIHAGLECGIFDSAIDCLDCISVGPNMYSIHSASERLSISSTKRVYEIVTEVLKNCK